MNNKFIPILFYIPLWCWNAFGAESDFKGKFQGVYAGVAAGLQLTRMYVNNQAFHGRSVSDGFSLGSGLVFDQYYVGIEGSAVQPHVHLKKPSERVDAKTQYHIKGRFGKLVRDNFLAYLGIGPGFLKYNYRGPLHHATLKMRTWCPEIGVDAFAQENLILRSSLRYNIMTSLKKSDTTLETGKKSRSFSVEVGVFYKF